MKGYTLTELLVALAVFILVAAGIFSFLVAAQRFYSEGEDIGEVNRSGRMITKKITKEFRQAREIVTELPAASSTAAEDLEFEDGRREESYYYIHYFKEGGEVKREVLRYYFPSDPEEFLPWDATSSEEELATTVVEGPIIAGRYVSDLKFWGEPVLNISVSLQKEGKEADFQTKVFGRNLSF